jgi:small-conductance mechanosensitive channel
VAWRRQASPETSNGKPGRRVFLATRFFALVAEGIELPFPQYEIRLKDERIRGDRLAHQKPNAAE